ncbi:MAG: hypothetical protein LBP32_05990 [Spirochaetaceae bacterium]|jgi:hypothetical protein|nr:hypothetical protein [Spirochaetaceae bacterium]
MIMRIRRFFLPLVFMVLCPPLYAQTSAPDSGTTTGTAADSTANRILSSTQFDMSEFPLWTRDLRRAEIVAFGSLPFTVFFAILAMDTYRYASSGGDSRYAPWPFKSAGAIDMDSHQRATTIIAAAMTSLAISIADYIIVRHKRTKAEEEARNASPGEPIIIRSPRPLEDAPEEGSSPGAAPGAALPAPGENPGAEEALPAPEEAGDS